MNDSPELRREAAFKMAVNAVINYLRESGITEQSEKRMWITRVFDAVRAKELIH